MEDEQGCSGSTPSYCRADQFRCGTTCIPNVSENAKRISEVILFIWDRIGDVMAIEVRSEHCLMEISSYRMHSDCADGSDEPPSCGEYSSNLVFRYRNESIVGARNCTAREFRCVTSGNCIPDSWVCDHEVRIAFFERSSMAFCSLCQG